MGLLPNDKFASEIMDYDELGSPPSSKSKQDSRARRAIEKHKSNHYLILLLALFGSCMIIADGVLTPAISVLSASTGLKRSLSKLAHLFSHSEVTQDHIDKALHKYVPVPTACAILVCLFTLQHYGTHKIGFLFAPIVVIWILCISGLGLYNLFHWNDHIIYAINPIYMFRFIKDIDISRWKLLGSIALCIAGSESMFADLGHFSKKSIKVTFVCLVYPALILCYAGQAAFISRNLGAFEDVVHLSETAPNRFIHHIFTVLSLFASAVGSQATITASFSIINQCQALGCFPRVKVIHTSDQIHGQVYVPDINWVLMVLSLAVTIGFHDVKQIANPTGLAIISGMLVTTCLMSLVIGLYWEKSFLFSICFLSFFGAVETFYLASCLLNFQKGTLSLVVLVVLTLAIMLTWHYGTFKRYKFDVENKVSVEWLTELSPGLGVSRVPGIGLIYSDIVTGIPAFFTHFITNLPAFHQVLIFVSFKSLPVPSIPPSKRYLIGRVGPKEYRIYRCIVRYGYSDGVRDTDDFENHIIHSIGEFISREEHDFEALTPMDRRMIVVGSPLENGNALIPSNLGNSETQSQLSNPSKSSRATVTRKKVRFMLPPNSPKLRLSVREELQELVEARERGTAYFVGQPHLTVREGSNFLKQILIKSYVFLDRNCREPPVALNIPHAALVEVGMVYIV